jgi:hypothetical protein
VSARREVEIPEYRLVAELHGVRMQVIFKRGHDLILVERI